MPYIEIVYLHRPVNSLSVRRHTSLEVNDDDSILILFIRENTIAEQNPII